MIGSWCTCIYILLLGVMSLVWSQKFTTKKNVFRKLAVEFKRKYTRFCKYFDAFVSSAKFVGLFHVGVKLEYLNIDTTIFNLILFLDGFKITAIYKPSL